MNRQSKRESVHGRCGGRGGQSSLKPWITGGVSIGELFLKTWGQVVLLNPRWRAKVWTAVVASCFNHRCHSPHCLTFSKPSVCPALIVSPARTIASVSLLSYTHMHESPSEESVLFFFCKRSPTLCSVLVEQHFFTRINLQTVWVPFTSAVIKLCVCEYVVNISILHCIIRTFNARKSRFCFLRFIPRCISLDNKRHAALGSNVCMHRLNWICFLFAG